MFESLCFFTIRRSLFGYFYLLFVCRWIYRISYLYYALFAVIISLVTGIIVTFISNFFTGESSKRSCLSWSGKKLRYATGIFFLADMNTPDDFDKKFVHRWVDRVFCYLPLGCQKVNRLQKYVSLHFARWPKNRLIVN